LDSKTNDERRDSKKMLLAKYMIMLR